MKKVKYPKLSKLLRLALKDAQAISKDERYELNMLSWHNPRAVRNDIHCSVCLAGAVMALTLDVGIGESRTPDSFGPGSDTALALLAIDSMRKGDFVFAADYAALAGFSYVWEYGKRQIKALDRAEDIVWQNYDEYTGRATWPAYEKAAKALAKAGL